MTFIESLASTPADADRVRNSTANKVTEEDQPFHNWYRFVLSFPPHLVRSYIQKFNLQSGQTLLDPFCGTGTTVIEAKLNNIDGTGIEANPMAHFASSVKVDWDVDPENLINHARNVANQVESQRDFYQLEALKTLPEAAYKLLLGNSIYPIPLHKALILLETIKVGPNNPYWRHERLAFATAIVKYCSNLHFAPEVGVRQKPEKDPPVLESWLQEVEAMAEDISQAPRVDAIATIHHADSREVGQLLSPCSLDGVFTSPPYPNEKDYTRTTRLETVLLGFAQTKEELRHLKKGLLRSNTRGVYKGDDDDQWVAGHAEIQRIAQEIENRRIELGKTSGFERMYHRAVKLYFGGMARHFASLRPYLKPGAMLGYVVGDQASYLQVMIRTGQLLAEIAQPLGYEVVNIDLFRTRLATATKQQMREEVVVLRWPG
ncbi:DNA methyltransferase [Leptolyngbya sp. 'hensonii']|uniref:DNA methyltransferase n=1 Tax=Leptolyngbya sp. 'hensonii' TaxID=1922337 RepID=UPI00094FB9C6|nr:DNA methyltransferase [Leptolyngbya sp. 'hensonii']OLP18509.1 DNA methyltransferase [Leptolyngbya sp. 'hensonii']